MTLIAWCRVGTENAPSLYRKGFTERRRRTSDDESGIRILGRSIAPVFDIAQRIHVVEADSGRIVAETGEVLTDDLPVQKSLRLVELGVSTLVCGAISRPFSEMVAANGIRVIPFVAGDLNDVIQTWLRGNLDADTFVMPGCRRNGRRRWGMREITRRNTR